MDTDRPANQGNLAGSTSPESLFDALSTFEFNLLTAIHQYRFWDAERSGPPEIYNMALRLRIEDLENRVLALETRHPPAA
jgi:hypothetical protein